MKRVSCLKLPGRFLLKWSIITDLNRQRADRLWSCYYQYCDIKMGQITIYKVEEVIHEMQLTEYYHQLFSVFLLFIYVSFIRCFYPNRPTREIQGARQGVRSSCIRTRAGGGPQLGFKPRFPTWSVTILPSKFYWFPLTALVRVFFCCSTLLVDKQALMNSH